LGDFLDNLIAGADITAVLVFCSIFGGLNILRIVLGYITSIIYVNIQTKMGYSMNMSVIKHVQNLSLTYTNIQDSAYLNQRINSDANELIIFCITILQRVITNTIALVVPLIILLNMNWFVAVLFVGFLTIYIALFILFKKPLYNAGFAFKEAQSKFFAHLYDQLKYIKLVKLNSIQPEMNKRAEKGFNGLLNTAVHNQKINYLYAGMDGFVGTLAQIVLFVVGGIQVLRGNFTIGMFTIFSSYFTMMMVSCRYFFNLGANYQKVLVSYDRITQIFNQKPEASGEVAIPDIHHIELKNVNFSYAVNGSVSANSPKILANFNATFEKGKIYGICGENGTGKSTLVSLIMGMYQNEFTGSIKYNGFDMQDVDMNQARKIHIGFAEQEPMLINDTIRYNLTFNDATDLQIDPAHLQTLNMRDFIEKNTLDLTINDNNTNTSGGEKQKISILKVLHKNPAVMVFDEPTSALDAGSASQFVDYLLSIKQDKIIIIITHDEAVIRMCDVTIELENRFKNSFEE